MCDCEPAQVQNTSLRKARKAHKCCECARTITPGQQYEYISGVWDGRGADFKTCLECVAIRAKCRAGATAWYCEPCFGGLADEAREQGLWYDSQHFKEYNP